MRCAMDDGPQAAEAYCEPMAPPPGPDAAGADEPLVIVAFTGRAGSGKDSAADHLCEHFGFVRMAFADPLKQTLEPLLESAGVDYAALYEPALKDQPMPEFAGRTPRHLMQTLGDWGRAVDPGLWVNLALRNAGLTNGAPVHYRIVFTDVRYPNEALALQQRGAWLVRIEREDARPLAGPLHSSEMYFATLPCNRVIGNHGPTLAGLQAHVDALMQEMAVERREPVELEFRLPRP